MAGLTHSIPPGPEAVDFGAPQPCDTIVFRLYMYRESQTRTCRVGNGIQSKKSVSLNAHIPKPRPVGGEGDGVVECKDNMRRAPLLDAFKDAIPAINAALKIILRVLPSREKDKKYDAALKPSQITQTNFECEISGFCKAEYKT